MSQGELPETRKKSSDLKQPGVLVKNENRRDSFSSVKLQEAIDNSIIDSISFNQGTRGVEAAPLTATSETMNSVPASVRTLVLTSKALHKTEDQDECVFTLRRLAFYFAKHDGVCTTKADFAKIYKEIHLPGDLDDPEPEFENDLQVQGYAAYAHSRCSEAIEELKAASLNEDKEMAKLSKCVGYIEKLLV